MTAISDGFAAAQLSIIGLILLASGWNKEVADGLKARHGAAALAMLVTLAFLWVPLGGRMIGNGAALALVAFAAWTLLRAISASDRLYLLGCAFLLGFLLIWLDSLFLASPQLVLVRSGWDSAWIGGMLAAVLSLRARYQLVILAGAAILVSLYPLLDASGPGPIVVGDAAWWDRLALSAAACRVSTLTIGALARPLARLLAARDRQPEGEM
ncbi:hypothetical protein HGI30_10000 [Paenibacillus albicereus]|uniref:Uncharacterized protein n=1 Tax=Paenibacillus albicereus TaxID=2726185 RepID=A0A6H2GWR4_9BACL|nr:hypothetical protein [Paenibacillus albicereus]QJC51847.1 hypothetical protein HGI30_10000 [Paenibacillus albicereus]